ncbi:hypothetical protein D9C73_023727 [Collichthys lucidus]|uniref:Uncharacterized protein n=1 Tax=Collichthys lucidus TaxID=240159 RepID=A0A4U5VMQ9_COLLU|nr:hypothetical protein D9C73_023727 [Collichthys lucidus]
MFNTASNCDLKDKHLFKTERYELTSELLCYRGRSSRRITKAISPALPSVLGSKKRRIKLVVDREYETSSTGEDSMPETQRNRLSSTLPNSHANLNGSIYVAQNGSIIRTRRSVNATGHTHSNTNNNLKLPSPVFSSRLAKHFKKLDKMAATLEERVPLNSPRTDVVGCNTLSTFQSSGMVASATATSSFSNTDNTKTLNEFNARQSSLSLGSSSTSNSNSAASKSNVLKAAQGDAEQPQSSAEREDELKDGERESKVDGSNDDDDNGGLVTSGPPECPSDRTQSDEEELWMGPWNSLHIPMTKL